MTQVAKPLVRTMSNVEAVEVERTRGASIQVLMGVAHGAENFATRCFTLESGGRIPCHRHDSIEHEQVMLEGEMMLGLDDTVATVKTGDCMFIPAGVAHWYENRGEATVRFLCMVPITDEYQTEWLEEFEVLSSKF